MSMALAYAMKKKAKKMAEGGNASPYEGNTVHPDVSRKEWGRGARRGTSLTGEHVRGSARAEKEGMHKASSSRMESAKALHREVLSNLKNDKTDRTNLAEGGMVDDDDDMPERSAPISGGYADGGMVDRIMKKRCAEGGEATRDEDVLADFLPNEFDEMELEPSPHAEYPGSEERGDEQEDEDRRDMVSRIMRSRAKRDRMPRPA